MKCTGSSKTAAAAGAPSWNLFFCNRNLAAQANVQAFRAYHNLLARYSPEKTRTHGGYLIVPEQLTLEEWKQEAVKVQAYQRRLIEEAEREEGKT